MTPLAVFAILYCLFLHYRLAKMRHKLREHWREHSKSMYEALGGEDFDAVIEAEKREG